MSNPVSGPARDAGPGDELAGILRGCADRVPGSLERLLAHCDEPRGARVGRTLAGAAVAGPELRAALAAACAEAASFDPAHGSAEAWLAARVRRARGAGVAVPSPARTDMRGGGEPSGPEADPASLATDRRHEEGRLRVVGGQDDRATAPPAPVPDGEVGDGAGRGDGVGQEDVGARDDPAEAGAGLPPGPAAEEVDYRWVANYQRAELRSLEARVDELERRLRRRTVALLAVLAVGGSGTLGVAFLAATARLEPPWAATRAVAAAGPGEGPAGAAGPVPTGGTPELPAPPVTGAPPSPEAGPPPRAEPSRAGEPPAAVAPGDLAGPAGRERLEAKDPQTGAADGTAGGGPGREPSPDEAARPAGDTAAEAAAPQAPPDGTRPDVIGGPGVTAAPGAATGAAADGPRGEGGDAPPGTPPPRAGPVPAEQGGEDGSGAAPPAPPSRGAGEPAASGPPRPPTPPSAPAGDAAPRPSPPAPPAASPRGPGRDGRPDRGAGGGNAAAEALRAALAATRRSLEGPGAAAGGGAPSSGEPGSGPR